MSKKILFIDCCVRGEQSRTLALARRWLAEREPACQLTHLKLYQLELAPLSAEEVVERKRTDLAEQFAQADEIVVAAPYWDLSFPSILKVYLEHVCVTDITFHYVEDRAEGLCQAKRLVYVSTAGGYVGQRHLGEEYVRTLSQELFGIPAFLGIRCEGLDLPNCNPQQQLASVVLPENKEK